MSEPVNDDDYTEDQEDDANADQDLPEVDSSSPPDEGDAGPAGVAGGGK